MNIQWYPGHMTKAMRGMREKIKLVDLIIELVDARAPRSSINPELNSLAAGKARLVVMTKADLADPERNEYWKKVFEDDAKISVAADTRNKKSISEIKDAIELACADKRKRDAEKGIRPRAVRAMVVGIPNVGKSTFINTMSGRTSAKTGNKPGVTKGQQWIRTGSAEILDTPGVTWSKFDDEQTGTRLALIGSISDDILNIEELAAELIQILEKKYPDAISGKYFPEETVEKEGRNAYDVLGRIAAVRNLMKKGGAPDTLRAARLLIDDFRAGRLGRITLD